MLSRPDISGVKADLVLCCFVTAPLSLFCFLRYVTLRYVILVTIAGGVGALPVSYHLYITWHVNNFKIALHVIGFEFFYSSQIEETRERELKNNLKQTARF